MSKAKSYNNDIKFLWDCHFVFSASVILVTVIFKIMSDVKVGVLCVLKRSNIEVIFESERKKCLMCSV